MNTGNIKKLIVKIEIATALVSWVYKHKDSPKLTSGKGEYIPGNLFARQRFCSAKKRTEDDRKAKFLYIYYQSCHTCLSRIDGNSRDNYREKKKGNSSRNTEEEPESHINTSRGKAIGYFGS